MEFFNLPVKSKVDKNIPKEIIYKNAEADEKFKRIFIENVEKIRYEYALNYENSNIEKYLKENERYDEIHFLKVILREIGKENIISKLLHQLIPKCTVLMLEYEEKIFLSMALKRVGNGKISLEEQYNSGWIKKDDERLKTFSYEKLNGNNMKIFYSNIIDKVRALNLNVGLEGEVNKEKVERLEVLNREIEELKKCRKKETQLNRVAEIQNELLKKIREREKLMGK